MSLHSFLTRLIWLCVLPLLLLSAFLAVQSVRDTQSRRDFQAVTLARAVAAAIDQDLIARINGLQILAASPLADTPARWGELYREAQGFRESFGSHVILADLDMRMLFNTRVPFGSPLPALPRPKGRGAAPEAIATGKPAVGDIVFGPIAGEALVAVAVPGMRDGKPAFLFLTVFETRQLQGHLDEVALPAGWSLALVDGRGEAIAGSLPPSQNGSASVDASGHFAIKSAVSPWSISLDIPSDVHRAPMVAAAIALAIAVLGVTLIGVLGGTLASRRLGKAVASLAEGEKSGAPTPGITEIAAVRRLLDDSAASRLAAEAARNESDQRFRAMFEQAAVGIARVDTDGRWLQVNQRLCDIVGYSSDELLTKTFQEMTHPDDLPADVAAMRRALAGGIAPYSTEKRYLRKSGASVWVNLTVALVRRPDGEPDYFIAVIEDDERRKRAEERVRNSRAQLNTFVGNAPFSIAMFDREMRYLATSTRWIAEYGRGHADLIGRKHYDVHPDVLPEWKEIHKKAMAGATMKNDEDMWVHKDGSRHWLRWVVLPWTDENGAIGGIIISAEDITDRRRAEVQLRESEERFRQLAENVKEVFWLTDPTKSEMLYISPAYDEIWGRPGRDLFRSPGDWINAIHVGDRERIVTAARTKQARGDYAEEYRIVRPDGAVRWISDRAFPIADQDGRIYRIAGVAEDITDGVEAREALRESQRRFSDMLDNVELVSLMLDSDARITYCNEYLLRLTGWRRDEVIGRNWFDVFVPAGATGVKEMYTALLANSPDAWHHTNAIVCRSGEQRTIQWNNSVLRSPSGAVIGTASIGEDITDRSHAAQIQAQLAAIVEFSDDAIIGKDIDGRVTSWNEGAEKIFGYTAAEMVGHSILRILPPDRRREEDDILRRIRRGEAVEHFETIRRRKDGRLIDVSITVSPIKDAGGTIVGASKIARDITEKRHLEQQLRQSQKLEAMGQLTGGIAHDFNNLLGVVIGNLDLLESLVAGNAAALGRVAAAQGAALRGADLTRRLLGFSSREQLKPVSTSTQESISNMIAMAARALGPDIRIVTRFDPLVPNVLVDPSGFENALLNLAVNARDAMPSGGVLTIATELRDLEQSYAPVQTQDVPPGRYACVTVSDTGEGMSNETRERAFEPFFTTKPRGKGTGLGLAMVYGFVKQSGGTVRIYSEEGHGTSIWIYLPLAPDAPPLARSAARPVERRTCSGTVLVVDDEADLLEIAVTYLREMGFRVLQATDGAAAFRLYLKEPAIDLLVTDIIMPGGMNGVQLAQNIRRLNPDVRVVYTSGYPSNVLSERSGMAINAPLLNKPFQRSEFIATIYRAMDANPASTGTPPSDPL